MFSDLSTPKQRSQNNFSASGSWLTGHHGNQNNPVEALWHSNIAEENSGQIEPPEDAHLTLWIQSAIRAKKKEEKSP